ncbi:LysR family transcriptional regulator [Actinomadura rudentiformis]|uniref:LysR family transcriptional regulator n=1 Tax=Actinomadura rudentiformis TaxID=359158 RepID=A0A6H9YEP5_9ACTN|nr:LysR substrate-binding domain-containing protein [Actinomadura rudentiformis]KAB2342174.1 LysR family transcriptional regulator [Actinomadura rudentiformis]
MELRQLEYFVAVTEEASFTRAAARLHVAQPGVSAQIRQLERELGLPLLDRSGRTVRLTEAGSAVLPYARAALSAVAGARLVVDELTGLVRGHVTVGVVEWMKILDLPGLLAGFHRDHPQVEITLSEARAADMIDALRAGQLDLGFISMGAVPPEGLETQVILDQAVVAAVAPGDPLARRDTIPLNALRGRKLICLPKGTGVRTIIDDACAAAGFTPDVSFEIGDPLTLAQLAARGLGVAVLPESATLPYQDELHTIEITRPRMSGRIALAWRAGGPTGPAARALIDLARERMPAAAPTAAPASASPPAAPPAGGSGSAQG